MNQPIIKISSDTSLAIEFGSEISYEINSKIRAFDKALAAEQIEGIVETVPTYCSLTIHYEPELIRYKELREKLETLLAGSYEGQSGPAAVIEIPVLYGGEFGPDLEHVAEHNSLTPKQVIELHSGGEYLVYMLGFTPGFSYLGGMDERLATPRLKTPRVLIPGGSVGIAGAQTGIYPMDSPGGWQLIGRTPVKLYDPRREQPILLDAGEYIKFRAIDQAEYDRILAQAEAGTYQCKVTLREEK
ncbi:MAG: 5-oxoprolinase subunit PxpB [Clostridiales bacterium]|nr:5-oxoprolinase subunit PxpB [Clostridiales bacterium]